jgi:hypothetical protein
VNRQQSSLFLIRRTIGRTLQSVGALAALTACLLVVGAFGQNNPVPQIVGPVHPDAVAPGGGDFTLSVYGANFVSGAAVNWNYQPRTTTYVSGHEVQAQILSTDIANNTAGYITVTNPAPGGGSSSASWAQVEVHAPISTIVVNPPAYYDFGFSSLQAADFSHDGTLDLVGDYGYYVDFFEGGRNGKFSFTSVLNRHYLTPTELVYGDFNNDGNLDVTVVSTLGASGNDATRMDIMMGNGEGAFTPGAPLWSPRSDFQNAVAGDFNQDGNLDLMNQGSAYLSEYLGNGNGTFRRGAIFDYPSDGLAAQILAGDFNGDGKLDLILLQTPNIGFGNNSQPGTALWFLQGNGDGTFQSPAEIASFPGDGAGICSGGNDSATSVQLSDFNGDGKLDLSFCNQSQIGVMLGNGDGTFQPPTYYTADTSGIGAFAFAVGDINSDGKPDLIVSEYSHFDSTLVVFLGNGDGTFQAAQTVISGIQDGETGITLGDFNLDGLLDVIFRNGGGTNVFLQQQ